MDGVADLQLVPVLVSKQHWTTTDTVFNNSNANTIELNAQKLKGRRESK